MYTVLVVENDTSPNSIINTLDFHFGSECALRHASSSRDIFQQISHRSLDIVLLDLDTSGISGTDMCRFLQNSGSQKVFIPVLSLDRFDHAQFENSPSVLDYLVKPYSRDELILTMEEALQHCRAGMAAAGLQQEQRRADIVKVRILQYIQDHYGEGLSMQDVAQAMNYSDTHFCRLFKQCFGVNFSVYLNEFRVEQAKQMLADTNAAVKEVGRRCGYRDTSYFIRVFKRQTGMTPNDYRINKFIMTAK